MKKRLEKTQKEHNKEFDALRTNSTELSIKHKQSVQQAISEGKIKSHPDYPELTKPRINLETSKSEALKLFAEGKTDREISNTLSLTGREGISMVS